MGADSRGLVLGDSDDLRIWEKARPDSRHVRRRSCTASHRFRDRVLASYTPARHFHPSLFSDDVVRIADLQTKPLTALLLRPFNEHIAPVFELVSWTTWQLAGRLLSNAAVAFTAASIIPFLLCMPALGTLVRRESRSVTSSGPVHDSALFLPFRGPLRGGLVVLGQQFRLGIAREHWSPGSAFSGPLPEGRAPGRATGWWIATVLAAAAAPACSAIGLLAGPLERFGRYRSQASRGADASLCSSHWPEPCST